MDADVAKPDAGPSKPSTRYAILHGNVIDLVERRVVHALSKKLPRFEAIDERRAYLVDAEVIAYDVASGVEKWRARPTACARFAIGDDSLACSDAAAAVVIEKRDGSMRKLVSTSSSGIEQLLAIGGRVIVRRADRTLETFDATTKLVASRTLATVDHHGLVPNKTGACAIGPDGADFTLTCVGPDLSLKLLKRIVLKKPTDPPSTYFHTRTLDARWAIISSWFGPSPRRGVVVRLSDGAELARLDEPIAAVAERDDGTADGIVTADKGTMSFFEIGATTARWSAKSIHGESAAVRVHDERVVIASFHAIASGASLESYDRASGKKMWAAEVELLPIAHSAYLNDVTLEPRADAIVMHGNEAAFTYLQLFDWATGKRLFSEIKMVW